jgi:hypothetical protein
VNAISRELNKKEYASMASVRKKTANEIFRTPRWLRGPPRSLRNALSDSAEEISIYQRMRRAIIEELRPRSPIEWILVNEVVNAQYSAMRHSTWQAALMQFAFGNGLKRAAKSRLRGRPGIQGERDLDWWAEKLAPGMRRGINNYAIEAEMYLSRRVEMDSIHKRRVSALRRRDSSLRLLEQRRSRQQKEAMQMANALMGERKRDTGGAPEYTTLARTNGTREAPELQTGRKSGNGHG